MENPRCPYCDEVYTSAFHHCKKINAVVDISTTFRAGGIASYEASDLDGLRREFEEQFLVMDRVEMSGIAINGKLNNVWSWIVEKFKAR